MIIHVVKEGDTIHSIARDYQISEQRLLWDNGLIREESLVIGQTIVIVHADIVYTVKEGDTLISIAEDQGIDVIELLRNNSFLSERDYVYTGEMLVISYEDVRKGNMRTNGYAFPFIDRNILHKTLPYLSFLSIYEYVVTPDAGLIDIDDEELIALAKSYGVAPIMVISSLLEYEQSDKSIDYIVLTQMEPQRIFIENVLEVLEKKGYYGLNLFVQSFISELQDNVVAFLHNLRKSLNEKGFYFMITITPYIVIDKAYEEVDFSAITEAPNGVLMLSYSWGYSDVPPGPTTPLPIVIDYLDFASQQIQADKNNIGVPVVAYHWELPYVEGESVGNAISIDTAIRLARETNSVIQYDEIAGAPYFYYTNGSEGKEPETSAVVWFKDARTIDILANLVLDYGLQGMAIWSIMSYNAQLWFILNTQYEIERINLDGYEST